ncbi:tRNA glutamyl-Q(34) synthetase GluQRS [Paenibacillus filicis]|uniref:Glutamyl-Q tRNA(Asp) synthetase n=1 Tax=Paenibacillus gyeongsangnamensis TaxID=3388067 RepID=A0ABT4QFR0_9BACL|nr:tRNA glutamyl-Q(34) synthetase GluQRS [Paenibacillus filicis]MCZ8515724.1 tRNA glutamyl-Q(34) synthetase GluQRS [Paenibacillus filicis]
MIRGRFAPTPSGLLHLGNAYTALLSWLQIRQAGGQFVMRMEDIDKPRSRPEYALQIMDDLRWLGIDWDEGPDVGGPYAPYTQSERLKLYEDALERLRREGRLYPCYCSRAELHSIASAPHGLSSEGPVYTGRCRKLTAQERAAREAVKAPSLRFALPNHGLSFTDGIQGPQKLPAGYGGDFVVRRADGILCYQLAVVVDDAAMGITDVLRGADLLDSTPRQLLLFEALQLQPPRYTHVPLLFGPDGERLSKRREAVTVAGIRAAGTPPEAVIGRLAYWAGLTDRPEPLKAAELISRFELSRVATSGIRVSSDSLQALFGTSPADANREEGSSPAS